jgi:Leucine-rich repeat (LRR) protein
MIRICILYFLLFMQIEIFYGNHTKAIKNTNDFKSSFITSQPIHFDVCEICSCGRKSLICPNDTAIRELAKKNTKWKNRVIKFHNLQYLKSTVQMVKLNFKENTLNIRFDHEAFKYMGYLKNVDIRFMSFKKFPNFSKAENLRDLTIQNGNLRNLEKGFCSTKKEVSKIDFNNNLIESVEEIFSECHNLNLLDLSHNNIKSINRIFKTTTKLLRLNLGFNQIDKLDSQTLKYYPKLIELVLSNNAIEFIAEDAFEKLQDLKELNLAYNRLKSIPIKSKIYGKLTNLYVSGNPSMLEFPDAVQFTEITDLQLHYSYHCCPFVNKQIPSKSNNENGFLSDEHEQFLNNLASNHFLIRRQTHTEEFAQSYLSNNVSNLVNCSPQPDVFSPCENLLGDWWLRAAVWIISIIGIVCNLSVVFFNLLHGIYFYRRKNVTLDVPTFLLTNLATADLLMAIYLLFIAVKDFSSRNNFDKSALVWQRSLNCNVAGFLSILSSLCSAFCLAFITFERFYAINNSIYYNKRITLKVACFTISVIWIISLFVAFMPIIGINSYSAYAICLPFDTKNGKSRIYIIALSTVFVVCFFFIFISYSLLFIKRVAIERRTSSYSSCNNDEQMRLRNAEDQRLAKNISMLVVANIICWGPLVIIFIYSLLSHSTLNRSYLKILAVFIIPFNSLINPILYCLCRRKFRFYLLKFSQRRSFKNTTNFSLSSSS